MKFCTARDLLLLATALTSHRLLDFAHTSSRLISGGDIESETRQAIANVDRLLRSADASLADIVCVTVYLRDMSDRDVFDTTYRSLMPSTLPTRTTVDVQLHGALLELTVAAYTSRVTFAEREEEALDKLRCQDVQCGPVDLSDLACYFRNRTDFLRARGVRR